ncbi:MAG TPA: peptidoglycan bridge formation glycyltransferase FemA/FemB family protein [Candidatus Saccharimonadales bacterium]|nr:peptidoglycan bridge formation glycyltransferase FemA/FemB family protein [Candidatus Saccharimonadales bacterium]
MGYTKWVKSFFQTAAWGEFKETAGWRAKNRHGLLELTIKLPMSQTVSYYPELEYSASNLEKVKNIIEEEKTNRKMFVRFEFLEPWDEPAAGHLLRFGLIKSFEELQPEHRQWVSLNMSEAKILEQMKPKGRYNIRIAERHKLKVESGIEIKQAERFFALYQQTATRAEFRGRGLDYFLALTKTLAKEGVGEIIIISKDGQDLAGGIFLYYQGIASYLYGGSGGDRSLMAPYLMHSEAMKRAKKRGCQIYDLLAVAPPPPAGGPNHPHAGLTRFKEQFGGETIRLLGSWDLVNRPLWYKLYRMIEKRRRKAIN